MAELQAIREAMATALGTISELQVSPWILANPTPPTALIFPDEGTYDQAMRGGLHQLMMKVQAIVATPSDVGAQMLLDRYLAPTGSSSIKAALEVDKTLGGIVQSLHVQSFTYRQFARPQGDVLLGADFTVKVFN